MSVPISTEKRALTATEFEVVERTHYPAICGQSKEALRDDLKLLREYRKKARDRAQQQRREMRGKVSRAGPLPPATTAAPSARGKSSPVRSNASTASLRDSGRPKAAAAKANTPVVRWS